METFLIKAAQLILALALLVVLHEFGHYIFARIFGIKVEKFYLFFNPWFSLVKWKPRKRTNPKLNADGSERATWRDTEYGIGWLPLGGYVKIAGMIDESMDKEQMTRSPQPWEFRTRPAWQRLLVMLGGVLFNFIVAIIIYTGIAAYWGEEFIPLSAAREGFDFVPETQAVGFRNGDLFLSADGKPLDVSDAGFNMAIVEAREVKVLRNYTDTVAIAIPNDFIFRLKDTKMPWAYRVPVVVDALVGGEAAAEAGLKEGDHIIAVDTIPTPAYTELTPALARYKSTPTTVTVERGADTLRIAVTPNEFGKLGFQLRPITKIYPTVMKEYTLLSAIPKGWEIGTGTLGNYVSSMRHVFSREGVQSLGGFGALGSLFPEKWSWYTFWQITAFLSVVLAFMNLIPIPGLDGGHVMLVLIEMITHRQLPDKAIEVIQYIGMSFLLLLLIYANGMDLVRALL